MKGRLFFALAGCALFCVLLLMPGQALAKKATLDPVTGKTVTARYPRTPTQSMIRAKQLELAEKSLKDVMDAYEDREIKKACSEASR